MVKEEEMKKTQIKMENYQKVWSRLQKVMLSVQKEINM
jgi:hypothetical protein